MAKPFQLGRGLGSLIPSRTPKPDEVNYWGHGKAAPGALPLGATGEQVHQLPLVSVLANFEQPRQHFEHQALEDLAASVKIHGILQPLVVSPRPDGRYNLIVGERRLRAAKAAGLTTVPALVRQASDQQRLELALIENIQRQDLNPLEEAAGYRKLQNEFGLTQEAIATRVGKSRAQIANALRLFQLPPLIQDALRQGKITFGHAKVILGLDTPAEQERLFQQIIAEGLSVRLTELKVRGVRVRAHERGTVALSADFKSWELELQRVLGTKVKITNRGKQGTVEITYYSAEDLASVVKKLGLKL